MDQAAIIKHTRQWVETVVIGLHFCPFAKREADRERVRYVVLPQGKYKDILESLLQECQWLDRHDEVETSLLIMPQGFADFSRYLDLLDKAEGLLAMANYEGIYQLASFHPEYCFADTDIDDAANFTNRSPYPVLHVLRENSLEKAIAAYPDIAQVPADNIQRARSLGAAHLRHLVEQSKI